MIMRRKIITLLTSFVLCVVNGVSANEPLRPVLSAYMVDYGGASVLDTYLSPIKYKGKNVRVGYERMRAMKFNPERWVIQYEAGLDYAPEKNPAENHTIHTLMADLKWGMMHRWNFYPVEGLQLYGGGSTQLRGGALYAPANSNNVVSVKATWSLDLMGMAVYNCKIGKIPVTFRYQATLPMIGIFYSPEYGESYYEIYVGNHSGLVHFGWVGNHFSMNNLVTADLHIGKTTLRIGYRNVMETSWINNLNTRIFRDSIVLGVCGEWLNIQPGAKHVERARVISAMY